MGTRTNSKLGKRYGHVRLDTAIYLRMGTNTISRLRDAHVSHVFRRFLRQFSTDFDEILQGLFLSHAATTVKSS